MTEGDFSTKYTPSDYKTKDSLYRGYRLSDLNEGAEKIELNAIRFPDFSCNWSRFSKPADIRQREYGLLTDGCFSFSVGTAQYREMATPCHDPLLENYSHTEVRQLTTDEPLTIEPPKRRKLSSHNWSKTKRLEYRQDIVNNMTIELEATV